MSNKTWEKRFKKLWFEIMWKQKKGDDIYPFYVISAEEKDTIEDFINQTIKEEIQTAFDKCLPEEMHISKENNLAVRAEYYRVKYKFKDNLKEYLNEK